MSWLQWNGQFRDDVRSFVRGDPGMVGRLMSRLYGSCDLFSDDLLSAYRPYQSVNFITCHDGFCLNDLVSYNRKHNESNGHGNTDGTDSNFSWNCGWEGSEGVSPGVVALRKQQIKNFCALLFLSNGTPMFCAGDEFMNTQKGNNNPYNQDNEVTWLDWELGTRNHEVLRFFRKMIAFRKAHPSLSRSRFWREDVRWYGAEGQPDLSPESRSVAFFLRGAAENDQDVYAMINASGKPVPFQIQQGKAGQWSRAIDTSLSCPDDFRDPGDETPLQDARYFVSPRSVVVLLLR